MRMRIRRTLGIGIVIYLLFGLGFVVATRFPRPPEAVLDPFAGPLSFVAWFLLPAISWPANVAARSGVPWQLVFLAFLAAAAVVVITLNSVGRRLAKEQ